MKAARFVFAVCLLAASPSLGRAEETPRRIVSLAPAVTEIVFALGAGDRLVGVTQFCEYPPEAKAIAKVGGYLNANLEYILTLRPDLVIVSPNSGSKITYEKLRQLRMRTAVVRTDTLAELLDSFALVGKETGRQKEAAALIAEFERAMVEVKTHRPERGPRVVFVNWRHPLMLAGKKSMENEIMAAAGVVNAASAGTGRYPEWNQEALVEARPEIILDAAHHKGVTLDSDREAARQYWRERSHLKAVRDGQIYLFKENVYSVPGPRTVRLIRAMGALASGDPTQMEKYYERLSL